ncbi:hypothetical protein BDV97DRAFT_234128 [Delphinella strobiligena]|nr:hypothetical protein BDV97DRAFT_234128 [Delphinella strobiligena]
MPCRANTSPTSCLQRITMYTVRIYHLRQFRLPPRALLQVRQILLPSRLYFPTTSNQQHALLLFLSQPRKRASAGGRNNAFAQWIAPQQDGDILASVQDWSRAATSRAEIKMQTYLDATERGAPFYIEHLGSEGKKQIDIEDRPAYGQCTYVSHVRPIQSTAGK